MLELDRSPGLKVQSWVTVAGFRKVAYKNSMVLFSIPVGLCSFTH